MDDLAWFFLAIMVCGVAAAFTVAYMSHEEQVCKSAAMAANKSAEDALMLCSREDYMKISIKNKNSCG